MSQNRFNELGTLNIRKYIVVDVENILNEFSKKERRIKQIYFLIICCDKNIHI
jgi:hypothetical protein